MSTQKQLSRTTGTDRIFKEELALSLICWVFTSPFTNWTDKVFSGIEVPSEGPSTLLGETEISFVLSLMKKATTQEGLLLVLIYVVFHFRRVCSQTLTCLRKSL